MTDLSERDISLKDLRSKLLTLVNYLLTKGVILFVGGALGGVFGFLYVSNYSPNYTAQSTFVLEEGDGGGNLGSYAGLASMVGIDLAGGSNSVFQGDNIIELYRSRKMIEKTLLSRDTFDGNFQLLIERYIDHYKLKEKWKNNAGLANLRFEFPKGQSSLKHDSIIGEIVDEINTRFLKVSRPDKKLSIIRVEYMSTDELFAKSFTENIVKNVNNFYVSTKTRRASENIAILQHQADSVKNALNMSLAGVAAAIDANPNTNPVYQSLRVPSQRRQIDVQANSAIYQEIVKNLELSKIALRKEKPLIQIIDEPVLPLKVKKISRIKTIFISVLISITLTSIFLLARRTYTLFWTSKNIKAQ